MRLTEALRVSAGDVISFVGAGGKSSAIRRLVQEQRTTSRVVVTTTTNLGISQTDLAGAHLTLTADGDLARIPAQLDRVGTLLVTGPRNESGMKWTGLREEQVNQILPLVRSREALLLVEADGARMRSFKVPAAHEPPIPLASTRVVPIVGLDVIGTPLGGVLVHRSRLLEQNFVHVEGSEVEVDLIVRVLNSPLAGLKNIPDQAEIRVLLNKIGSTQRWVEAEAIAQGLLENPRIQACLLGEMQAELEPVAQVVGRVAGVILAAGEASRMGQPKQLLEWNGKPLLWYAIQAARGAGLDPLVVVIGSSAEEIQRRFEGQALNWVHNPDWQAGQSSSLIAGLQAVEKRAEGVVFFLSDMPLIPVDLVRALRARHRSTLAPAVAPRAGGRRANPALFDRCTFPALKELRGDAGGRQLFELYPPEWVDWEEAVFIDIDTPEDLGRLP